MHNESECSETKDFQASMVTALTDLFDITYKDSDRN